MGGFSVNWNDVAPTVAQQTPNIADAVQRGESHAWDRDKAERAQQTFDNDQADRSNRIGAGQQAAAGDFSGAQNTLFSGGQLDAGYKLNNDQFERSQRDLARTKDFASVMSRANSPEEYQFAIDQAKKYGVDTSMYAKPGEDWTVGRGRARELSNYTLEQLNQAKIAAEAAHLNAEAKKADPDQQMAAFSRAWGMYRGGDQQQPPPAPQANAQAATPVPGVAVDGNAPAPNRGGPTAFSFPVPQSGAPTSTTPGGAPFSGRGYVPDRASDDDRLAFMSAFNPQLERAVQNMPGQIYSREAAKLRASDDNKLQAAQRGVMYTEPILNHIEQIAVSNKDLLPYVTGPWNNNEWVSRLRTLVPSQTFQRAWDLRQELEHNIELLGNASKSGNATDQQQAVLMKAVGQFMNASDPRTFFSILYDAKDGMRSPVGLPPWERPDYAGRHPAPSATGAPGAPTGQSMTATNPQTGQRITSTDGGRTWSAMSSTPKVPAAPSRQYPPGHPLYEATKPSVPPAPIVRAPDGRVIPPGHPLYGVYSQHSTNAPGVATSTATVPVPTAAQTWFNQAGAP